MSVRTIDGVVPGADIIADRFRRKYWELHAGSLRTPAFGGVQDVRRLRFNSVTVPLDGSRYAEHALPLALEVAAASKASVVFESAALLLGHTFDRRSLSFEEALSPRRRDRMHLYLKGLADRWSTESVQITARLSEAPIPARLLRKTAGNSNLVVMSQRSRSFTDPFSLGRRVEKLLRLSPSPLILVRGYRWPYTLREAQRIKHILVVLDGTADAEDVLPASLAIAEAVEARLTLLCIVAGTPYYGTPSAEKELEAKAYLESVVQAVQRRRATVEPAVWSSNESLGQVILSYAQNGHADLIALTTSLRRALVGSFRRQPVRYLFRRSRIPLLIVNSDKAASHRDPLAKPHETA